MCFFCDVFSQKKSIKSSRWTTLDKFDLIRVFDEYNVCVCKRRTIKELMVLITLVASQTRSVTIPLLAHITFIRFLVRVNTHVGLQIISSTKSLFAHIAFIRFLVRVRMHVVFQTISVTIPLLANITFVRFLVRVNTHVVFQITRLTKSFIAHTTLVRFLVRVNMAKLDGLTNIFSHTSHSCCCVLFLFVPFFLKVVSSFCI